jgi:hypothetical protein
MATITMNGHTVEAASQQEGGTHFVPSASQSNFILIQCHEFLKTDQIDTLKSLGVTFMAYFADNTYLCRYEPSGTLFVFSNNGVDSKVVQTSRLSERYRLLHMQTYTIKTLW